LNRLKVGHEPRASPGGQDRVQGHPEGGVPPQAGQPTVRQEAHHHEVVHQAQAEYPGLPAAAFIHGCLGPRGQPVRPSLHRLLQPAATPTPSASLLGTVDFGLRVTVCAHPVSNLLQASQRQQILGFQTGCNLCMNKSGANVMLSIWASFNKFRRKSGVFLETDVMMNILHQMQCFE
jgi:hypothetical protein